jgi:ribosomal subunit interface protein
LQDKIREKLAKLERHLQHFPRGAVHLHIALEKNLRKELFRAALVLRVPSNILRAEKSAADPIPAVDYAVKILLRQLAGLKSELRREALWRRKPRRAELHTARKFRFADIPVAAGTGLRNEAAVLRALIDHNYARLLRYVRRHLWHEVNLRKIPEGAIDVPVVVDEVARQALAAPEGKPAGLSFQLWLYVLARRELARRCNALQQQAREMVRLERSSPLPDVSTVPPDEAMAQAELLEEFQKTASQWPKLEREAFELYFVEGYESEEIGMVLGLSAKEASELLTVIRRRLRETLLAQAAI